MKIYTRNADEVWVLRPRTQTANITYKSEGWRNIRYYANRSADFGRYAIACSIKKK